MTDNAMTRLETPDSTISYERIGGAAGAPLFVLHGGPGFDHRYLRISPAWEELGAGRPVVFYDQRGTGQSSEIEEGDACTLADQLADLEALREHLGYDRIDVLGHSWGGFLGMAYTARRPERVRRLIVVDSAAPKLEDTVFLFEHIFPETEAKRKAVAFGVEWGDEDAVQADIAAYMSMLCYSAEKRDALLARVDPTTYRRHVNLAVWQDARRFDLNPEIAKFRQPTLVITGRYDINVAPSVAYGIHRAIPDSRLAVFEESGHLPFYEEPEAFVRVVEGFLSKDPEDG